MRGARIQKKRGWGTSCDQGKSLILLELLFWVCQSVGSVVHIIMYIVAMEPSEIRGHRGVVGGLFVADLSNCGTLNPSRARSFGPSVRLPYVVYYFY